MFAVSSRCLSPDPQFEVRADPAAVTGETLVTGVAVDREELAQLAEEMRSYYEELADRMQSLEAAEAGPREFPEDRMFV